MTWIRAPFSIGQIAVIVLGLFLTGRSACAQEVDVQHRRWVQRELEGVYVLSSAPEGWVVETKKRTVSFRSPNEGGEIPRLLEEVGLPEARAVKETLEILWSTQAPDTDAMDAYRRAARRGWIGPRFSLIAQGGGRYVYEVRYCNDRIDYSEDYRERRHLPRVDLPKGFLILVERVLLEPENNRLEVIGESWRLIVTDDGRVFHEGEPMFEKLLAAHIGSIPALR